MIDSTKTALTDAQVLILSDLVSGDSIKKIAMCRHIKRRTVGQHIADARKRLGAQTRDQAIAIFVAQYGIPECNGGERK